ncbi:transporter substrate-binding protein [Labrys sp. WJW]|uniref:transporter substrate-binding protein n=1 Tax=Labrys sp. WJW TaxID=1737983 RepID=UPI001FDA194D|nr:transporter substrate-binding protein [Labrys sp. WJW]
MVVTNDDWKIGVLLSKSGVTAAAEIAEANVTLLVTEEINAPGGVLGRRIAACEGPLSGLERPSRDDQLAACGEACIIMLPSVTL